MTEMKIALSIEEAADYTGIGRNTLRDLVKWKKLPVLQVGRKVLIKTDILEQFMEANEESFPDLYDPDRLLQMFTNRFKEKYGVECASALHHNKRKTNYHIHLIFSERELLPEPIEKVATRNMFYNEQKKHVRTKKEILDDSGNVRKGCKSVNGINWRLN